MDTNMPLRFVGEQTPTTGSAVRCPIHVPHEATAAASRMTAFTRALEAATGSRFPDYAALHDFSVRDHRNFWRFLLHWSALRWTGDADPVRVGDECETAVFFPELRLNYAENLLAPLPGEDAEAEARRPAVTSWRAGEDAPVRLTRGELRGRVERLAQALSELGLRPGDRVVAVVRNDAEAIVAALAVAALGAAFSSAAPEMGADAIVDRFAPLSPRLLVAHLGTKPHDTGVPVAARVARVAAALPSLEAVVSLDASPPLDGVAPPVLRAADLAGRAGGAARASEWERFPFNHPLFIMFSSGTTGRPKCIVHGAGGTLLEHVKEHRLHCDLRPGDKMFFQTSCAWMMWNWQLSAFASGAEIVVYDGPVHDARQLWRIAAAERVALFGTSPPYLKLSEDAGLSPGEEFDLGALRAILSTGSILYDGQYAWARDHVGPVPVRSISGGTDIIGCFVLGNPNLPVHAGEAQCKSLGLDVRAAGLRGAALEGGSTVGELVCANPFPSRPLGFFGDAGGSRFHASYFAQNPGVWTHGDLVEFTPEGGARLHGRSDGVLNVRGIRVGPAEIYRILQEFPEVADAMAVEQSAPVEFSEGRAVLLLVLRDGAALDGALAARMRRRIAERASAAHVPDAIVAVEDLPVTHSGKRSEAAMTDAVNGRPVRNAEALRNPGCLDAVRNHPALRPLSVARAASRDGAAPAPGTERHLQEIWEALFGVSPIGPQDDFFDLGGHSLLAARLFAEIRRATGRDLPLATVFQAPTIERLAALLRDEPPSEAPGLVRLRDGAGGRPFFLVHSLSGTVMELWAALRRMRCARPVYGIQARGLDPGEKPHARIEDMAADHIGLMRTVQPHGPYALGGYSLGGLIAYEMARQLSAAGEGVELVLMMDTAVHDGRLPWGQWLRYQAERPGSALRSLRDLPPRGRVAFLRDKAAVVADRFRAKLGREPAHLDAVIDEALYPPAIRRVRSGATVALRAYRPRPYAGKVTFLRASVPGNRDPLPVWRRMARDVDVHDVAGDHFTMVAEPNAETLAAVLDRCL